MMSSCPRETTMLWKAMCICNRFGLSRSMVFRLSLSMPCGTYYERLMNEICQSSYHQWTKNRIFCNTHREYNPGITEKNTKWTTQTLLLYFWIIVLGPRHVYGISKMSPKSYRDTISKLKNLFLHICKWTMGTCFGDMQAGLLGYVGRNTSEMICRDMRRVRRIHWAADGNSHQRYWNKSLG